MSFKVSITQIAPPWLLKPVGLALLQTFGQKLDDKMTQLKAGIKARWPSYAPDDALLYIARDRGKEQGPLETSDNFRTRLNNAVPDAKTWGGPQGVLRELAGFFSGLGTPGLRLVSDQGVWHEWDWTTSTAKKIDPPNARQVWSWDGTYKPWRGWVIIDASAFLWTPWRIGDNVCFDDDGVILGSTTPAAYVAQIQRIVQKWKPAHVFVERIVVTFAPNFYRPPTVDDASIPMAGPFGTPEFSFLLGAPENPSGNYGDPGNWSANATFWLGGGEQP